MHSGKLSSVPQDDVDPIAISAATNPLAASSDCSLQSASSDTSDEVVAAGEKTATENGGGLVFPSAADGEASEFVPTKGWPAKDVAAGIRHWALSVGLVEGLPANAESDPAGAIPAFQFSEEQTQILRHRGISHIAYNNSTYHVYIYTKRRVTNAEREVLPESLKGCVLSYPCGTIAELGDPAVKAQGAAYAIVVAGGESRYACGSSISPGDELCAGTMGALVVDKDGRLFGLSNNHVTGACSHSTPGLPILAPGVLDVAANGLNPFTIGHHAKALRMYVGTQGNVDVFGNSDAAIFSIFNPAEVSSQQRNVYDTPTETIDPVEGMEVEKVGRTTGHTTGTIVGRMLVPVSILCSSERHNFKAEIWFANALIVHGNNTEFSDGGDSGSLVVTKDATGKLFACGLLFAGGQDSMAAGQHMTLILPIRPILEELGVTLVGGHNAN